VVSEKILKVSTHLDNWFHENHLIINTDKTKASFLQERKPN
jgi:hypothetical protein